MQLVVYLFLIAANRRVDADRGALVLDRLPIAELLPELAIDPSRGLTLPPDVGPEAPCIERLVEPPFAKPRRQHRNLRITSLPHTLKRPGDGQVVERQIVVDGLAARGEETQQGMVDSARVGSCHQTVAPEVIQPICVEGARHHGMIDIRRILRREKLGHLLGHACAMRLEQRVNGAAGIANDLGSPFVAPLSDAARHLHPFEGMAERAMAQVMQQGGDDCHIGAVPIEWPGINGLAFNDAHQLPRGMKHADGMGEAGVDRAREDEVRDSQLLDSPKSLKFGRID